MPRILLIEDEDSIRHLISYDLKNAGFDVRLPRRRERPGKGAERKL